MIFTSLLRDVGSDQVGSTYRTIIYTKLFIYALWFVSFKLIISRIMVFDNTINEPDTPWFTVRSTTPNERNHAVSAVARSRKFSSIHFKFYLYYIAPLRQLALVSVGRGALLVKDAHLCKSVYAWMWMYAQYATWWGNERWRCMWQSRSHSRTKHNSAKRVLGHKFKKPPKRFALRRRPPLATSGR